MIREGKIPDFSKKSGIWTCHLFLKRIAISKTVSNTLDPISAEGWGKGVAGNRQDYDKRQDRADFARSLWQETSQRLEF